MDLTHCDNKHFGITSRTGPVNCVWQTRFLLPPVPDASFPLLSPPTSLNSSGNFLHEEVQGYFPPPSWTCLLLLCYFWRDRFPSWHLSCLFPFHLQDSQVYKMLSFPLLLMRMACSGEKKKRCVAPDRQGEGKGRGRRGAGVGVQPD